MQANRVLSRLRRGKTPVLLDDTHRWAKFTLALVVFCLVGLYCALGIRRVRPSVFLYEERVEEYAGRRFALEYLRVRATFADYFIVRTRRGRGLRFTDSAHLARAGGSSQLTAVSVICGRRLRVGDSVSVRGVFRRPNIFLVEEMRLHPRRDWKFATAVPALVVVGFLLWRRLRRSPGGLALR